MTLEVEVTAASHVGHVRERNEDAALLGEHLPSSVGELSSVVSRRFEVTDPTVVAAIDGLGGHPGGDVASHATAAYLFSRRGDARDMAATTQVVRDASDHLYEQMDEEGNEGLRGMGATIAGLALLPEGEAVWCNVGDARAYALVAGRLSQLSTDDSPLGPTGGRQTSQVLQTIGGMLAETPIEPHVGAIGLRADDRYLLCTDGLTDLVGDDDIATMLEGEAPVAVQALIDAALAAGGRDNITVVVVDVV